MQTFLVGGAVRDTLLKIPVRDRDFVLVGATPEDIARLHAEGFRPVGKDFPVFLHPQTTEEYALARVERKIAAGHQGFACETSRHVTLEEDLSRRDLTINAMAQDASGRLVDPFGGQRDLEAGILRHVSPAFAEDPLRVLRVARFAARYGFTVAPETQALMTVIADSGELETLSAERIWTETHKALTEARPAEYFRVLRSCGALARLFPEVDCLFAVPQPPEHHPEGDTGTHTLMVLERAAVLSGSPLVRFCALVHDLGKGVTDPAEWPRHRGHEVAGVPVIVAMTERLRTPIQFRDLACLVSRYHLRAHQALELRSGTILEVLVALKAFQHPERLEMFLVACQADAQGRLGREQSPYPQAEVFRTALAAARTITATPFLERGFTGAKIGALMESARIHRINHARRTGRF